MLSLKTFILDRLGSVKGALNLMSFRIPAFILSSWTLDKDHNFDFFLYFTDSRNNKSDIFCLRWLEAKGSL